MIGLQRAECLLVVAVVRLTVMARGGLGRDDCASQDDQGNQCENDTLKLHG